MQRLLILLFTSMLPLSAIASDVAAPDAGAEGLIATRSPYSADETMDRFEKNARHAGLRIFDRIDHAAGARKVDMALRPTEVLVFGNPKGGTALMQCAQTIGIDLPLKALVWRDADGQVWLGYNDPAWIAKRHGVEDCPAVAPVAKALSGLVEATIVP